MTGARVLRGVIHDTDKLRIWIEDPEAETARALFVPPELAARVHPGHLLLFYDLDAAMTWARKASVGRFELDLLP